MASLILTIIFGLIIAYFATLNTSSVSLYLPNYTISSLPLYIVVVGAMLIGLLLAWIISIANNISTGFTIRGKENKIRDYKKEIADLTKRIHQLELENTKLEAGSDTSTADDKSL